MPKPGNYFATAEPIKLSGWGVTLAVSAMLSRRRRAALRARRCGIRLALPALSGSFLAMRRLVLRVRFQRFRGVVRAV